MKKKKLLSVAILLMTSLCINAQNARLSMTTRMLIAEHTNTRSGKHGMKSAPQVSSQPVLTVITTQSASSVDDATLEALGCTMEKRRGTLIFAYVDNQGVRPLDYPFANNISKQILITTL